MKPPGLERPTAAHKTARGWPLQHLDDTSLAARVLLALQVLTLLALTATVASRLWQDRTWVGFLLIAITLVVWLPELGRRRARRWWFVYIWGIFVYTILRALADETFIPTRWTYAKHVDEFLFFGTNPVAALQDEFFSPVDVSWLDRFAVAIHWSFFIVPHAVALAIFILRRPQFPRYAMVLVGTMWAGLVLFYLVPTAPPWLVASSGEAPNVFRVMDFVGGDVDEETYEEFYASLGEPNSVAAMPSIHEGVVFAMFLWAYRYQRRYSGIYFAYAVLTGLALVYLGEHYVIDLLVGASFASLCWYAVLRYSPEPRSRTASAVAAHPDLDPADQPRGS